VIAVGGGVGTLSEIALALRLGKPLAGLETWQARVGGAAAGIKQAGSPREAVAAVIEALRAAAGEDI